MRTPSPKQQRRGSSAASSMKNLVLTDSKLVGAETSEVQVKLGDEGENSAGAGEFQPMQLYSPSKDVLDELYKIIRNNKPPRTFGDIASHRRQLSDSSSKDNSAREENTRSPLSHEFGRIAFRKRSCHPSSNTLSTPTLIMVANIASSPVSRTLMRNPIIFNSQFEQEQH